MGLLVDVRSERVGCMLNDASTLVFLGGLNFWVACNNLIYNAVQV